MRFDSLFLAIAAIGLPVLASSSSSGSSNHASDDEGTNRYIAKLKPGVNIASFCDSAGIHKTYEYSLINGFAAILDEEQLNALRADSNIEYLAEDVLGHAAAIETQHDASWVLARVSTRDRLADQNSNNVNFTFSHDSSAGEGVDIYVLDTGIYLEHEEFGGRAIWGETFVPFAAEREDVNGHGTLAAGVAAGNRFGAAKRAGVIAVKVLNDRGGAWSIEVIAGMEWVARNSLISQRPSIASMSLTVSASPPVDDAVAALTAIGVHVVVAAGDNNVHASALSPARAENAITVGAIDITDSIVPFGNYGCAVDIFAPGNEAIGAGIGCPDAYAVGSGSSMATALVAGLIATLISSDGNLQPSDMKVKLKAMAIEGILSNIPISTPNLLVQNGLASL